MKHSDTLSCQKIRWEEREAYALSNGLVTFVHLTGGGHIAEFRFCKSSGLPTLNPLWIPPWKTMEPYHYRPEVHGRRYGPVAEGRLLSGIVGHNLCLDFFGPPSEEEARNGLPIHGEAGVRRWRQTKRKVSAQSAALTLSVGLPVAGLEFTREVKLLRDESVAYFTETVMNKNKADHFFHWQQHVTLSPPFLTAEEGRVDIPATRGLTSAHGYDGKSLLATSRVFQWPKAPGEGGDPVDLAHPLSRPGLGFLATVLIDPRRELGYVAALNTRYHLLIAYCFSRHDYPWVALWEENRARDGAPWSGRTQTRGLEFGSTPFPFTRRESFALGPLFGAPTHAFVPAGSQKAARYVAFLARVPDDFGEVNNIVLSKNEIVVRGNGRDRSIRVAASGLSEVGLA